MRTIEEADINARIPDLFRKCLLNFRARIPDILQISETENCENILYARWSNRHDRYCREFSISISCSLEERHGEGPLIMPHEVGAGLVLPTARLEMAKPTSRAAVSRAEPKKRLIDQIGLARLISRLS